MDSPPIQTSAKATPLPQTLEQLLSDTDTELFQDYQRYLEQSFCCENLHFWLDVQEYSELCGRLAHDGEGFQYLQEQAATQLTEAHQVLFHVVQQKCHAMIDTYIRPNASQEINIPCELRQELLDQVFSVGNYHPRVFTRSVKSVVELMRVNAFIPWISSYMTCPLSPRSPCLSTTSTTTTTTTNHSSSLQPLSSSSAAASSCYQTGTTPSSLQSSPTGLSFSFVVDRWYSFNNNSSNNKTKPLCRSGSMDSTVSWDIMDNSDNSNKNGTMERDGNLLDMSVSSPPPSPTASNSPPSSTKYRSMLQRVKHSFMPQPSTTKSSVSLKYQH
ncbi:RGS domain-containing protein [Absidia repens]|uniref:RGS domain-containing protein n=1 Tax=Absidia repens TaxID=90262 RepID=A0A1X2HL12_9FUNG|nr:RGS domain-containing protein [Absidia repens]